MQRSLLSWTSLKASIVIGCAGFGRPARTKARMFSSGAAQANLQIEYKASSVTTIILIEYDTAVCDAIAILLETEGFRVIAAKTVDEGLKLLAGDGIKSDLMITCTRLPGDNGVQATQRIRCALKKHIPAILLTSGSSGELEQAADQVGCRVLHKPVSADLLFALIAQLLKTGYGETIF